MRMDSELSRKDTDTLRRLAARKAECCLRPDNIERRAAWYALDSGRDDRPMVLAEIMGVRDAVAPLPDSLLECGDEWARRIERGLRADLYAYEILRDDHVLEPFLNVRWDVSIGDYGVRETVHLGENEGRMASRRWDPPIADLNADFGKLRPRAVRVDREATQRECARLESVLGDLLTVRVRGGFWWTVGLTSPAIRLIGLEGLMLAMYDNPQGLHRLMAFLRDDQLACARQLEEEGLLSLNNADDYIGSGSLGYTRDLPCADAAENGRVRLCDLWVLCESQETVGVGPELFEEFVFPYQREVAGRFGKCYYGCCEPVNNRWHILKRIPNLARVSVSPWADQGFMARELGRRYVFSRKPNPSMISTARMDEGAIRADLRATLELARGCRLEIVMKDVHTLNDEPGRLARWVQLAREEIAASR